MQTSTFMENWFSEKYCLIAFYDQWCREGKSGEVVRSRANGCENFAFPGVVQKKECRET